MRVKSILRMAFLNVICMRKYTKKLVAIFCIVVCTFCCYMGYSSGVKKQLDCINNKQSSLCYVQTYRPLSKDKYGISWEEKVYAQLDPMEEIDKILLRVENQGEFLGNNDYSYDFNMEYSEYASKECYSVPFLVDAYSLSGVFFSFQDQKEMQVLCKDSEWLLQGDVLSGEKEILISDYMLKRFGFTEEDFNNLIGKKITLQNVETLQNYCVDFKLKGIINSNIFYTNGNRLSGQFIIPMEHKTKEFREVEYRYYTSDFSSACKLDMLLSGKQISHWCSSSLELYDAMEKQKVILDKIVFVILVVLILSLFFSILTVLFFYDTKKNKYRCMLCAMGMQHRDAFWMCMCEVAICGLIGQGIGIGISCVLIWAMNTFVVEYLGVPMELANILNVFTQGSIFCAFLAFAGVVSWISMGRLKKERLTEELSVQE